MATAQSAAPVKAEPKTEKKTKVIRPVPERAAILVGKLSTPKEVEEFVTQVFANATFVGHAVAQAFATRMQS